MANGKDEPVIFTRGDAERLVRIETGMSEGNRLSEELKSTMSAFITAHEIKHKAMQDEVDANSRFRKMTIRIVLWVLGGTVSTGAVVKAVEIINAIK